MTVMGSLGTGRYRFICTSIGAYPATPQTELLHSTSHMREMTIPIVLTLVDCHSMIDSHTLVVRVIRSTTSFVPTQFPRRLCSTANSESSSSWISREVLIAPCQHLRWRLRRRNVWNPPVPSTSSSHTQNCTSLDIDRLVIALLHFNKVINSTSRFVLPRQIYRPCRCARRRQQRAFAYSRTTKTFRISNNAQLLWLRWLAHTTSGESSSYTPNETNAVGGAQ